MRAQNIEPYDIDGRVLLKGYGIVTVNKGNLSFLSKSLSKNILYSIVMSKYNNVPCSPWCSSLSSNCLGYIYLYEEENHPYHLLYKCCEDPLNIHWWTYLDPKKERRLHSMELGLCR